MASTMFMRVDEVAEELGVSVPYAYKLIRSIEYLTRWGPGLLRLGAIMSFGGYCVSRPGLLRLGAVVG